MVDVFPPALVPVLRDRFAAKGCLSEVSDQGLVDLLTTVFFAGLETYEGERHAIRVVFVGKSRSDLVMPEGTSGAAPIYRWKILRFQSVRPFTIAELVKLSVAGAGEPIYCAVHVLDDGQLGIAGLAREGFNADADPFVKIITRRPGCLSIRSGRERLLEYERGGILTGGEDVVVAAKPVRRALESAARAAGMERDDFSDYLDAVRALVREMAAHGRGGILIINPEERPAVAESSPYRMLIDASLAALLRLAKRIGKQPESQPQSLRPLRYFQTEDNPEDPSSRAETLSFRYVLRNSFLSEAERVIEELGALTGIDGATVLNCNLALVAFGVILPVGSRTEVAQALDNDGLELQPMDLDSRGTRHRASATYAAAHPGSVVFVASEDGQVACMFRDPGRARVLLWNVAPADIRGL